MRSHNIDCILASKIHRACLAERVIRSLKEIMFKYFHERKTNKWIDVIQDITNIYNNRYHRTINIILVNARNPSNYSYVFKRVNGPMIINKGSAECKFKLGVKVRKI